MSFYITAQNQFSQAMRCYLQVGIITTDFFSEPITKNVYDDTVCTVQGNVSSLMWTPEGLPKSVHNSGMFKLVIVGVVRTQVAMAYQYIFVLPITSVSRGSKTPQI